MITIAVKNIGGVLTPVSKVESNGFGIQFNGTNWLIFESKEEALAHEIIIEQGEKKINIELTEGEYLKLKNLLK
jgi:hypothetical protein